jgi:hypothetical protein
MSAPVSVRRRYLGQRLCDYDFRLVFIERSMAAAAKIIGCTELN